MNKYDDILIKQSRFILMGEMMANISHQWKQPLNTINLVVLSARTSDPSKEELEKYFDIIEKNVNFLASTITDFTSFLEENTCVNPKNIIDIIKEIKNIIDIQMIKNNIKLDIEIDANCKRYLLSSSISQVILNLLNNAKDAFARNAKDKKIKLKFIGKKEHLKIICCDNGEGIKDNIKDNIFDPYFTTKNKDSGTGIGLYMSKQIIKKIFGGKIEVDSVKGETCLKITIPFSQNCYKEKRKK